MRTAWQRQTRDFGHTDASKYSCLILDNRGIGKSDTPLMRYTTSEMAKDVIEVLDHVGWTDPRSAHVVGVSMGGMISQEMARALHPAVVTARLIVHKASMIPERIASLTLLSTAARLMNTVVRDTPCYDLSLHLNADLGLH